MIQVLLSCWDIFVSNWGAGVHQHWHPFRNHLQLSEEKGWWWWWRGESRPRGTLPHPLHPKSICAHSLRLAHTSRHWQWWWQQNMPRGGVRFRLWLKTTSSDARAHSHRNCHCTFSSFVCSALKALKQTQLLPHSTERSAQCSRDVWETYWSPSAALCFSVRRRVSAYTLQKINNINATKDVLLWKGNYVAARGASPPPPLSFHPSVEDLLVRGWGVFSLQGHIPLNRLPSLKPPRPLFPPNLVSFSRFFSFSLSCWTFSFTLTFYQPLSFVPLLATKAFHSHAAICSPPQCTLPLLLCPIRRSSSFAAVHN